MVVNQLKKLFLMVYIYVNFSSCWCTQLIPPTVVGPCWSIFVPAGCLVLWLHLVFEEACEDHSPGRTMMTAQMVSPVLKCLFKWC